MKKLLTILMCAVMVMVFMPGTAFAGSLEDCPGGCAHVAAIGTTHYDTLTEAFTAASSGTTIKLIADTVLAAPIDVDKDVTIDLAGHKITPDAALTGDYLLGVKYGGKLTIDDTSAEKTGSIDANGKDSVYTAVKMTLKGETYTDKDAILVVNGGTLIGYYYGVCGNGTRHHTDITINGGELKGTAAGDNLGIYHPQSGNLTVKGGKITGITGIAMKSGTLTISGGEIIGTGPKADYVHNGSGFNSTGDAVAVEACDYPGGTPVVVNISGGIFTSANGKAIAYYQQSEEYKLENEKFITGGTFNTDPSDYLASGYTASGNANGIYTAQHSNPTTPTTPTIPTIPTITIPDEPEKPEEPEIDENAVADKAIKASLEKMSIKLISKKANKGNKLSWKVTGEVSKVDGYQVFRSVKRYSGFGKKPFFVTENTNYYNTKGTVGTRYFYKVRAYAELSDGTMVYSPYSNKAFRIFKR